MPRANYSLPSLLNFHQIMEMKTGVNENYFFSLPSLLRNIHAANSNSDSLLALPTQFHLEQDVFKSLDGNHWTRLKLHIANEF